mgnify:CR=1 FL=1
MREWRRKALVIGGYIAFGLAAFLFSLYLTLPMDAVAQRLAHELNKGTGGGYSVELDGLSTYWFSGLEAEAVSINRRSTSGEQGPIRLDGAYARLQLLPLLWLSTVIDAGVRLGDGEIEASLWPESEGVFAFKVNAQDVNLMRPPVVPQLIGMPVGGVLALKGSSKLNRGKRADSEVKLNLHLKNAALGPGSIQGFTLPRINLGSLQAVVMMENGKLALRAFEQEGGDLAIDPSLNIAVRPRLSSSRLDACIKLKPDPAFLEKEPKMKTVAQLAEVQLRKDDDEYFHVPLRGTLGRPRQRRRALCRSR